MSRTPRAALAAMTAGAVVLAGGLVVAIWLLRPTGQAAPIHLVEKHAPAVVRAVAAPRSTTSGPRADPAWVRRTAASSGISRTAVRAYGDATLALAGSVPGCHLGWTTLAGVGTVESANGTIGGRTLSVTGYADRPITGPALDGAGGYAAVTDRGGRWARALGPMQFLRSSWERWSADGDGDGRADVDDIFDAALAAGRYLCADGHDLATAPGWNAAIWSYNHSAGYIREVYDAAVAAAR